jgi:hypothetical protein
MRTVDEIAQRHVLPGGTRYYGAELTRANRHEWFAGALEAVRGCEIVFLDPDNGLTLRSPTPQHVPIKEVRAFVERGQSVIVYHHLGMHMSAKKQVDLWRRELEALLPSEVLREVLVPHYHRGTGRVYFIVSQRDHQEMCHAGVRELLGGPWGSEGHFTDAR